jgi:hypothetical protein
MKFGSKDSLSEHTAVRTSLINIDKTPSNTTIVVFDGIYSEPSYTRNRMQNPRVKN